MMEEGGEEGGEGWVEGEAENPPQRIVVTSFDVVKLVVVVAVVVVLDVGVVDMCAYVAGLLLDQLIAAAAR